MNVRRTVQYVTCTLNVLSRVEGGCLGEEVRFSVRLQRGGMSKKRRFIENIENTINRVVVLVRR